MLKLTYSNLGSKKFFRGQTPHTKGKPHTIHKQPSLKAYNYKACIATRKSPKNSMKLKNCMLQYEKKLSASARGFALDPTGVHGQSPSLWP